MAVKKSSEEKTAQTESSEEITPTAETTADNEAFCVYIGPTIRGVIQSGTIYAGSREQTEKSLALAIQAYPLIARLIVTDKTFATDRINVKKPGNLLNVLYNKLASGKSI